jgi:hypothetical protein
MGRRSAVVEVGLEKHSQDPYKFIVAISLPDLGHEKPSPEELVEMAQEINYETGAAFLARLTLYLSIAQQSSNASKIIEVQEKLTRSVLSPARLQEIVKIFGDRRLYENFVLLNRAQLFVGIKLLAKYGRQEGGNCLETDADRGRIGELALAINSFYGPGIGEPRSVQKLYPTPAWNGIALELLGANREKYAKRCLSITRKVTEATSED